ncbi:MAG: hypothetical protein ACK5LE_02760 [Alphaproteobacteria bacterium]
MNKIQHLIAHIGAPKTASTSIQHIIKMNKNIVEESGYSFWGPDEIRFHETWGDIFSGYYRNNYSVDLRKCTKNFFKKSKKNKILLSEESLTHDLMPSQWGEGKFARIERTCDIIESMADNISIILCIRRQDDFLISTYNHLLHRHGLMVGFEEWLLNNIQITQLSWLSVIDKLEKRFGRKNLTIVPFEYIKKGIDIFLKSMLKNTNINTEKFNYDYSIKNPSLNVGGANLAIEVNKLLRMYPKKRELLISDIINRTSDCSFDQDEKKFKEIKQNLSVLLAQIYADENHSIEKEWFFQKCPEFYFSK